MTRHHYSKHKFWKFRLFKFWLPNFGYWRFKLGFFIYVISNQVIKRRLLKVTYLGYLNSLIFIFFSYSSRDRNFFSYPGSGGAIGGCSAAAFTKIAKNSLIILISKTSVWISKFKMVQICWEWAFIRSKSSSDESVT